MIPSITTMVDIELGRVFLRGDRSYLRKPTVQSYLFRKIVQTIEFYRKVRISKNGVGNFVPCFIFMFQVVELTFARFVAFFVAFGMPSAIISCTSWQKRPANQLFSNILLKDLSLPGEMF